MATAPYQKGEADGCTVGERAAASERLEGRRKNGTYAGPASGAGQGGKAGSTDQHSSAPEAHHAETALECEAVVV